MYDEYGHQYYDGVKVHFSLSGPSGPISQSDETVQPFGLDSTFACDPAVYPDATYLPGGVVDTAAPAEAEIDYRALRPARPWPCELSHFPKPAHGLGLLLPFDPFNNPPKTFHRFLAPEGAVYYVLPPSNIGTTPTVYTLNVLVFDKSGNAVCPASLAHQEKCPSASVSFLDPQAASAKEQGKVSSVFFAVLDLAACGIGVFGEGVSGGLSARSRA